MSDREDEPVDVVAGDEAGEAGGDGPLEEMETRHRKELKEMQAKIMALKKSVSKGDKKKKKQVQDEIDQLEIEVSSRQEKELDALKAQLKAAAPPKVEEKEPEVEETTAALEDAAIEGEQEQQQQASKKSKAQKRREKKEQDSKDRHTRILEAEPEKGHSKREKEDAAIKAVLKPLGLYIKHVVPDGNCLFQAVALQVPRQTVASLRSRAVEFMRKNVDDFLPFMTTDDGDVMSLEQFEKYCKEMETTSAWGGQCEIRAMALSLNIFIETYQANTSVVETGYKDGSTPIVRVSYHRHQYGLGEHYNAVLQGSDPSEEDEENGEEAN